jgi:HPt (histidine-containing phosphotransfer) domain-containing protein
MRELIHDLRGPAASIRSLAELLHGTSLTDEQRRLVGLIHGSAITLLNRVALGRLDAQMPPPPPLPLSPQTPAVLDERQIASMRAAPGRQGQSLLAEFLALFQRQEPARVASLEELSKARNWTELARTAHVLGGSAAILGAIELQQAAAGLEQAATAADCAEVDRRLPEVSSAWSRLQARLSTMTAL